VTLGLSDGQFVEVVEGLEEGAEVVVGAQAAPVTAGAQPVSSPSSTNPFAPQRERRTR
jgi:hypothetical protein